AVSVLTGHRAAGVPRPVVVVGRDTRPSGELLEAAVVAGLAAAGADVRRMGVVPTPAVAFAVADSGADLGVVLSASHNPMPDNGIKLFGPGGLKLPDDVEDAIEARLSAPRAAHRPTGADVGRVRDDPELVDRYVEHLLAALPAPLDGLRVVVDCAQGAASAIAPDVLRKAGADVVPLHCDGLGLRINAGCGATHLDPLRATVLEHRAHAGIAYDGDADRCLAVDATGRVVDGDQILALCALALRERGALPGDAVVATVMANLGFRQAMRDAGIRVVETPVGDRYVLEAMRADGVALGGEQSGHVVFLAEATTGDGLLTALHVLGRMADTGRPLADLAAVMRRLPQVLLNVRVADRARATTSAEVAAGLAAARAELGEAGRVLLRPSGTEPVVRVMVEAPTARRARAVAGRLAGLVERAGA
ncbi:MAG TPA: phosphoglucosamine mutase, partial [Frankiaceae bacterium]|nr:phosphoglucosamine mutase [Frankiaceae bacterium]